MILQERSSAVEAGAAADRAREASIPELVAEVYESAPAAERGRLLEVLMRPLGVLSLFGIAGGVFANVRFRSGWQEMHVRLEHIQGVRSAEVMALVDHAQQVSVETVDGLAQWLTASPVLSGSTAAAMLVTLLVRRARSRQAGLAGADAEGRRPH
jgi:hypothetical protein